LIAVVLKFTVEGKEYSESRCAYLALGTGGDNIITDIKMGDILFE
jgi:hypothetical protein